MRVVTWGGHPRERDTQAQGQRKGEDGRRERRLKEQSLCHHHDATRGMPTRVRRSLQPPRALTQLLSPYHQCVLLHLAMNTDRSPRYRYTEDTNATLRPTVPALIPNGCACLPLPRRRCRRAGRRRRVPAIVHRLSCAITKCKPICEREQADVCAERESSASPSLSPSESPRQQPDGSGRLPRRRCRRAGRRREPRQ